MTDQPKVQLSFAKFGEEEGAKGMSKSDIFGSLERFDVGLDKIKQWFDEYEVDSIELWISGLIETGGLLKLIVSAKGEGGMKVVLKPK